jgi:hypothetical protein
MIQLVTVVVVFRIGSSKHQDDVRSYLISQIGSRKG